MESKSFENCEPLVRRNWDKKELLSMCHLSFESKINLLHCHGGAICHNGPCMTGNHARVESFLVKCKAVYKPPPPIVWVEGHEHNSILFQGKNSALNYCWSGPLS
jgi:hypothetical protein